MAEGNAIERLLSNPVNWLAGVALGLGGLWLGSGFSTTGWLTGLLGFLAGITGSAIVTQAVSFNPFQPDKSKAVPPEPSSQCQPSQEREPWLLVTEAMQSCDLLAAEKAGIETLPITKPEDFALRGKFRFRRYLQKQVLANREIDPHHPAITAAIADLAKANTPDAYLEMVYVYRRTGDLTHAERTAKEGQTKFHDPRFENELISIRLEKTKPKKPSSPGRTQEKRADPPGQAEPNSNHSNQPRSHATPYRSGDMQASDSRNACAIESALLEFRAQDSYVPMGPSQALPPFPKKDSKTPSRA